ncbi:MAG: hypothetical protein HDT29_03050 [Clostridiales bacterium]|nr:hypothetical protein [Clostridiales bacterium]
MDAIVYILAQVYLDLYENIYPNKSTSNATRPFLIGLCLFINAVILVSLVSGIFLLFGYREEQIVGIILLVLGSVLGLFNMIVIFYNDRKNTSK